MTAHLSQPALSPRRAVVLAPLLSLTWLAGNRIAPWTSFEPEAWVAGLLLVLTCWWLANRRPAAICVPHAATLFLVLALLPCLQWLSGKVYFLGTAWTPSLTLAATGLTIACAASVREQDRKPVTLFFSAGIILASLLSVVLQSEQFFDAPGLFSLLGRNQDYLATPHKAYGFLAQPNLLATLQLTALMACLWIQHERILHQGLCLGLMILCIIGVMMSGSRTGMLSLLLVMAVVLAQKNFRSDLKRNMLIVGGFFMVLHLAPILLSATGADSPASAVSASTVGSTDSANIRLKAWAFFGEASLRHFWTGYGWGQGTFAYLEPWQAGATLSLDSPFVAVHNAVLDLALFAGWPLAAGFALCLLTLCRRVWQNADTGQRILLCSLIPFAVHSQLELPHFYVFFLLPFAAIFGLAHSPVTVAGRMKIPLKVCWLVLCAAAIAWALTVYDYLNFREKRNLARFEIAHITNSNQIPYPKTLVLTQLSALTDFMRLRPAQQVSLSQLEDMEQAVMLIPIRGNTLKLSLVMLSNNQPAKARFWMERACVWTVPVDCKRTPEMWDALQEEHPDTPRMSWPARQ